MRFLALFSSEPRIYVNPILDVAAERRAPPLRTAR
jgi:hypothetical protein